jgi:hypothetical protein
MTDPNLAVGAAGQLVPSGGGSDRTPAAHIHERAVHPKSAAEQRLQDLLATVA